MNLSTVIICKKIVVYILNTEFLDLQMKTYFFGLFGKMGIKPELMPEERRRICSLVLSKVTPMELINRAEQASWPSH